jgi:hypothetical protein
LIVTEAHATERWGSSWCPRGCWPATDTDTDTDTDTERSIA